MPATDPESVVQAQLVAYNARDIDAFLATYTDDIELHLLGSGLQTQGKDAMRLRYIKRFSDPLLHAVISSRMVMGNIVIDHERVFNTFPEGPGVMEAVAIYEVRERLIAKVTFVMGPKVVG